MGKFSDILLTVDFDRTLTAPDSTIPPRNREAIRWFMEEGRVYRQYRALRAHVRADFAYIPGDATISGFERVCDCAQRAVADVIKKSGKIFKRKG